MALMSDSPQVGDTVRLTHTIEGDVFMVGPTLTVSGWALVGPNRTVEILSRATPSLPDEDGFYVGYDKLAEADLLAVVYNGKLHLPNAARLGGIGHLLGDPERFAPFRPLVLK